MTDAGKATKASRQMGVVHMTHLAAILIFLAKPAAAEFLDGNRISRWCLAEYYQSSEWFCDGYVAGVADTNKELCIPKKMPPSLKLLISLRNICAITLKIGILVRIHSYAAP